MISNPGKRTQLGNALCILLLAAMFVPLAQSRFIAGDEGFYIYAAELVARGKHPYTDFFYPQMPLLPYLFSLFVLNSNPTIAPPASIIFAWMVSRGFVALFSIAIGYLAYELVRTREKSFALALGAATLYATCDLVIGFFPIVKTYSLSTLFLLLCFFLMFSTVRWKYFLAGMFFACSVSVRLQMLLVLPVLLWALVRHGEETQASKSFCHGALFGILPVLVTLSYDPVVFYFNNLGYHSLRNRVGLVGGLHQKIATLQNFLGYSDNLGYISYQFGLLAIAGIPALFARRKSDLHYCVSALIAFVLIFVSFLPTPVYLQYFCVAVPFLAIACIYSYKILVGAISTVSARLVGIVFLILFLYPTATEYARYTRTGYKLSGVYSKSSAKSWRQATLAQVVRTIDSKTKPGDFVVTTWPGYLVGSHARVYPGLENHFSISIAKKLSKEEQARYHILSREGLVRAIETGQTGLVVTGYRSDMRELKPALKTGSYRLFKRFGRIRVFERSS